jgi:hypothetical protein
MKLLLLDSRTIAEVEYNEAVRMIDAGVAVEAPKESPMSQALQQQPAPESAMLDRAVNTAVKPVPVPRQAPVKEKRRRKR